MLAAWLEEYRAAAGLPWSRRGIDAGHSRNLWALEADADLWRLAFRLALAQPWYRKADDPFAAFMRFRNKFRAKARKQLDAEESRRRMDAENAAALKAEAEKNREADERTEDERARIAAKLKGFRIHRTPQAGGVK